MESVTRDLAVVPNQEGDENSMIFDPSIQASLQRPSSIVSENIAAGDDLSAGMESSIPVASSKNSEITEAEDDPSPGMEPSLQTPSSKLDPAEDKQSSETGSTSLPWKEVNPFMKNLSGAKDDADALAKHYFELKQSLNYGLQKEAVHAFLEYNNMTEAQAKVQELFYLLEAIEYVIKMWRSPGWDPRIFKQYRLTFKRYICRIDIYYRLFIHALSYATKLREPRRGRWLLSDSFFVANLSEYFEATDFMVFLINKVQEEDTMDPSLEYEAFIIKCVHMYQEETISTFICLVASDEDEEAEDLFKSLLKCMKPSDIINRGRVYNYALQKAQELLEVHKFLSSQSLSQRHKDAVQCNNRLNGLAMEYDNQVKVHRFLVDLYLRDDLKYKIDWDFVQQHDYPYLIKCVWERHKRKVPNDVQLYNWTPLQLKYVFTSSAAIVGGEGIMKHLLEAWPALVNAPYKGVAALHIAVFKGNEEVIKYLLMQEGLDINVRTGLLRVEDVKTFQSRGYQDKGVMKCKDGLALYPTVLKEDCEDLIKDPLLHQNIKVRLEEYRKPRKVTKKNLSSRKKWNMNRWTLPTYQTALHMATTQRDTKTVKLLCDAPELHQQKLQCHEEDEEEQTPLDILHNGIDKIGEDSESSEIEKILLNKQDVQNGINRLYNMRQVLVDAVNTVLVGAALIAGVTFAGWLQPPLGYAQYHDLADSYLAVQDNLGVKAFALFNSLSFFFAIATVIICADAAFPIRRYQFIGHIVESMHILLQRAIKFLITSLVCVLGAFGSAAIVVLPPSLFFRKDLVLTIIIGGSVCGYALWHLLSRHSERVQRLKAYIAFIISFTKVF